MNKIWKFLKLFIYVIGIVFFYSIATVFYLISFVMDFVFFGTIGLGIGALIGHSHNHHVD